MFLSNTTFFQFLNLNCMMKMHKKSLLAALVIGATFTAPVFAQDVQSGLKDLESERLAKAEQTFTQLATSAPTAENQFYLGYYYLRTNQPDKAKAAFEKGLSVDPKNELNNIGLAGVALAKKDAPAAIALTDNAVKATKGKNMDVLFHAGEVYTLFYDDNGVNDPAKALSYLEAAAKLDKKNTNAEIKMAMGDAYFIKNDGGSAVSRYEDALMISPNLAEANYKIGRLYLRGKQYKLAQEYFDKAIANDPEFALTYRSLADALAGARAYKGAAKNMELYVQKSGTTDPEYLTNVAKFYFLSNDYLKAISYLDQLKGKVNDPIIDRMYGWAYSALGKTSQSIEALNRFIAAAPKKVLYDDYVYLGRAYGQQGTPEGDSLSVVYLLKAAPEDTVDNLYREAAQKLYSMKKYEKAGNMYLKSISANRAPAKADYIFSGVSFYTNGLQATRAYASDTAMARSVRKQNMMRTDSVFAKLAEIDSAYASSYYYRAQANYYAAATSAEALSNRAFVPYAEKFIALAGKEIAADAAKQQQYSKNMISSYRLLIADAIAQKDDAKAKNYATEILKLDANDKAAKELIEGPATPPAATPATGAKPVKKS